jgi:hypothetical protein
MKEISMMNKAEIENKIHNLVGIMYETGYARGLKERKEDDQDYKDGLEDGRMEAWEAANKIILGNTNGGLTDAEIKKIFNKTFVGVLVENTATEVITKIREYEKKQKCKECKWDEFRDAQSPVGTPCDSCFEGKNFSPKVAKCCSVLDDICPYDISCAECEVHCSVERAKQKLKGDKEE